MKVYVVVEDGWDKGWGSQMYITGVYDTKEMAKQFKGRFGSIIEIPTNEYFPLKEEVEYERSNDYFVGGYYE